VSLDKAQRRFSAEEAAALDGYLRKLADYCVASTVWWEDGHGEPVEKRQARSAGATLDQIHTGAPHPVPEERPANQDERPAKNAARARDKK
jgi:hypothetical protein